MIWACAEDGGTGQEENYRFMDTGGGHSGMWDNKEEQLNYELHHSFFLLFIWHEFFIFSFFYWYLKLVLFILFVLTLKVTLKKQHYIFFMYFAHWVMQKHMYTLPGYTSWVARYYPNKLFTKSDIMLAKLFKTTQDMQMMLYSKKQ